MSTEKQTFVIVGARPGRRDGGGRTLREQGFDGRVVLIGSRA